jgi:hypothetical protein
MSLKTLSQQVKRILIDTFTVSDWEIETDSGWHPVSTVSKTVPYDVWKIVTVSGKKIECADDHIVFDADGNECFAKDLKVGLHILTANGPEPVTFVGRIGDPEVMYDLEVDSEDHRFYSNGILSHNSITTCAFLLWTILFKDQQNIAILANKLKTSQKLLADLKNAYMCLPLWIQQGVVKWNERDITLENGSKIMASSTSSDAIRGNAFNLIFLDEFAFVPEHLAEDFFNSVMPTISSGNTSKIIIVSTPKGMNKFHRMWKEANNPRDSKDPAIQWNGYEPFSIHWSDVPKPNGKGNRDEAWKKQMIAQVGESQFMQEYECEFIGSSNTLIDHHKLQTLTFGRPVQQFPLKYSPQFQDGTRSFLDIHKHPVSGHQYVLCADVAEGKEKDSSAFCIVDIASIPYEVVAKYKSDKISTMLYPDVIIEAATLYNMAWVMVETNDNDVAKTLYTELEYENLITTKVKARATQVGGGFAKNIEFGLRSNRHTKRIGCANLKTMIETDKIIIRDYHVIEELLNFVANSKGSYSADSGKHDDLVMCLVSFSWLVTQPYFRDLTDSDIYNALRKEYENSIDDDVVPFGFISSVDNFEDDDGFRL